MCSSLVVLVADPYRTEASCAVLGCLHQAERRRGGRRVQHVFSPSGAPEPGLLQGAEGAVLVLLEGQKAASEALLHFWEELASTQSRTLPVLSVLLRTSSKTRDQSSLFSAAGGVSPVVVAESDIFLEHGGIVSLSQPAQTDIEQALHAVLQSSASGAGSRNTGVCRALAA